MCLLTNIYKSDKCTTGNIPSVGSSVLMAGFVSCFLLYRVSVVRYIIFCKKNTLRLMFFSSACALVWFKSDCIINWGERKAFRVYNTDIILLKFTCEGIYTFLIGFMPFFFFIWQVAFMKLGGVL